MVKRQEENFIICAIEGGAAMELMDKILSQKNLQEAMKRVMKSVSSWLERKLFLKVNMTKTKVVRPSNSSFLGFTFWKNKDGWKSMPTYDRKQKTM